MEKQLRVIALVGSLRRESYTRRVVNALTMLLSSGSDGCGTNERNAIERGVADSAFEAAAAVFAEKQLVDLTLAIGLMNAYNRMAISFRATPLALAN